jgi:hypothetical protein
MKMDTVNRVINGFLSAAKQDPARVASMIQCAEDTVAAAFAASVDGTDFGNAEGRREGIIKLRDHLRRNATEEDGQNFISRCLNP